MFKELEEEIQIVQDTVATTTNLHKNDQDNREKIEIL